ncbi:MAG: hypothetical protein A2509_11600 [Candidatus Edwardsbacteria bacterium RIFOXYD12_FULL_50_11]|jgi:hypothetical protein|uniref:Uncharacterized protein n=1 Tax=Candidatus Edwardsbacteria bacterium GWF2_54_11 TaxID=1817851 RepID=A0A1F5R0V2_9BACT|nr:MAG: hypothetical protein A2502_04450 [Candidatus Edwardsbacteria bacterium RifOxyC12_full_54_24]OGF08077.1 MAG: hypothetical protein A2024_04945 [Candidatus Edwardsbacteria bacterium GWF2_54_11]OGF08646.1 MAG: hypothetical protein A2273_06830 [Candidatus Edwardsbacteria bacterium RifOxyA12_full_54_48]OGF11290.1 MAG: hypothetical protein A3K15_02895 [Candidatus Edwardsbacteria bacterium GWE2_54_12]OGF16768.1 MAG: hypothetical protein A2509_11600 [Candidatus Edwardsbacteria bacterium RIFOXYD1
MRLDGSKYIWEPDPVAGFIIDGYDDLGPRPKFISIVFPLKKNSAFPLPGLEFELNIDSIAVGVEIEFGDSTGSGHSSVSFRPPYRPTTKEGLVLAYESREPGGCARIVVDQIDARYRGLVKGRLVYARLPGYYYDINSGDIKPAQKPTVMEFFNWPFTVLLDKHPLK